MKADQEFITGSNPDERRIHAYLRAVTARARDTESIGPFLATFSRSSTNPFLNYAIPDDDARPSARDVEDLIRAYERRGLHPRLEYITTCAPWVEAALLAAGFVADGGGPLTPRQYPGAAVRLMTCRRGDERECPIPAGIELVRPQTDDELLAVRTVQHGAYGDPEPPDTGDMQALAANLIDGGMAVLARVQDTGEPAGAGEYTSPMEGLTELAGVAVRTPFRRRGIAAAMTTWLVRAAFDAGVVLSFLMANETEERIYARAGFHTTSRILHISRSERNTCCGNSD